MLYYVWNEFFFLASPVVKSGMMMSMQKKLVNDMLEHYDKKVKPTWLAKDAVVVSFSLELYQIIEVVRI